MGPLPSALDVSRKRGAHAGCVAYPSLCKPGDPAGFSPEPCLSEAARGSSPRPQRPPTHPRAAPDLGHSMWTAEGWTSYVQTHMNLYNPHLRSWKTAKPILPHFQMWSKPCLCPLTGELHQSWMTPDPAVRSRKLVSCPAQYPTFPAGLKGSVQEEGVRRGLGAPMPRLPPPRPSRRRLGHSGLRRGLAGHRAFFVSQPPASPTTLRRACLLLLGGQGTLFLGIPDLESEEANPRPLVAKLGSV